MKVDVFENRELILDGNTGTQNENNIQKLEINVPKQYKDYNKKIAFITDDGVVWGIIENNTYTLKKNITKYKYVHFYIWLTKDEDDFRSEEKILIFNENHDASNEITEEELGGVNKVINLLEEEIKKVTDLETNLINLINDVQFKLDNGEFNGKDGQDYILTEQDKEEIAETTKPLVETSIQPTLENNLKSAKDYTDNSIARDFKDISYDSDTATFVFTRHDNTTFTIDLPIEQTVKNGYYDETTKELVLVLVSDQEIRIPATGLIDDYAGVDSATIQCTISADNKITCNIIAGSITKTLLTTELQAEIDNKVNTSSFVFDETTETLNITI